MDDLVDLLDGTLLTFDPDFLVTSAALTGDVLGVVTGEFVGDASGTTLELSDAVRDRVMMASEGPVMFSSSA